MSNDKEIPCAAEGAHASAHVLVKVGDCHVLTLYFDRKEDAEAARDRCIGEAVSEVQPKHTAEPVAWIRWEWNRSGGKSLEFFKPDELSLSDQARGVVYDPLYAQAPAPAPEVPAVQALDGAIATRIANILYYAEKLREQTGAETEEEGWCVRIIHSLEYLRTALAAQAPAVTHDHIAVMRQALEVLERGLVIPPASTVHKALRAALGVSKPSVQGTELVRKG